jgi:hypothetical protein
MVSRREAGGDDVFDDDDAIGGRGEKPRRATSFSDARRSPHAQRAADLVSDDQAADGGRQHDRRRERLQVFGERAAERLGVPRVLQHERALEIPAAVETGGKAEMAF